MPNGSHDHTTLTDAVVNLLFHVLGTLDLPKHFAICCLETYFTLEHILRSFYPFKHASPKLCKCEIVAFNQ